MTCSPIVTWYLMNQGLSSHQTQFILVRSHCPLLGPPTCPLSCALLRLWLVQEIHIDPSRMLYPFKALWWSLVDGIFFFAFTPLSNYWGETQQSTEYSAREIFIDGCLTKGRNSEGARWMCLPLWNMGFRRRGCLELHVHTCACVILVILLSHIWKLLVGWIEYLYIILIIKIIFKPLLSIPCFSK